MELSNLLASKADGHTGIRVQSGPKDPTATLSTEAVTPGRHATQGVVDLLEFSPLLLF